MPRSIHKQCGEATDKDATKAKSMDQQGPLDELSNSVNRCSASTVSSQRKRNMSKGGVVDIGTTCLSSCWGTEFFSGWEVFNPKRPVT